VKATGVTTGLAESNGSLLPGIWRYSLDVTCGLTACTPGSARGPALGNEYGKTLPYLTCIADTRAAVHTPTSVVSTPVHVQSRLTATAGDSRPDPRLPSQLLLVVVVVVVVVNSQRRPVNPSRQRQRTESTRSSHVALLRHGDDRQPSTSVSQ